MIEKQTLVLDSTTRNSRPQPEPVASTSRSTNASTSTSTSSKTTELSTPPKLTDKQLEERSSSHKKKVFSDKHKACDSFVKETEGSDPALMGNVIVSVVSLNKFINKLPCTNAKCKKRRTLYCEIVNNKGLATKFKVSCRECGNVVSTWWTSEKYGGFFTMNRDIVYGSLGCGMGAERFKNMCEKFNLSAMHVNSFQNHAKAIYEMNDDARTALFKKSAEIVRNEHRMNAEHGTPQEFLEDGDPAGDTLDIAVSYDGSWLTRGHSSRIGVGCVVDILTGLVVDCHVMSNYCQVCENTKKIKCDEKRKKKEDDHKSAGTCEANFVGEYTIFD